jgi:hypothetical protein
LLKAQGGDSDDPPPRVGFFYDGDDGKQFLVVDIGHHMLDLLPDERMGEKPQAFLG